MNASPIAAGGLILDVGGAIALASAFAFKRPRDVYFEARPYYGPNPALVISMAKQAADAWVGGTLLVLGFAGQFASSLGWNPGWACLSWTLPVASTLAVASLAWMRWWLRPWTVRRGIQGLLAAQRDIDRAEEEWKGTIIWLARTQGREIEIGERPSELAIWLMGEKRWHELTEAGNVPNDVTSPYVRG